MSKSLPGRIFISYRRKETAWAAGRLYDALVEHFPAGQVFQDVDSIEPGEDFVERITATVGSCDVLLALIGPQWLTITDENGQRRLDNPEDYVRLEIETALTRKIRVIPILVDDARMPYENQLPAVLGPLVRRNAVEISPATFDTTRLITAVNKTLTEEQARRHAEKQARRGWGGRRAEVGTSSPSQLDAAADLLAARTLATWSQQVVQRGIQSPAPVRVRWRWAAEDFAAPRTDLAASPSLATDPGPLLPDGDDRYGAGQVLNSGLVTRLHDEVYARLHHGRLVLIGGAGAGKTSAMILLLLEALRYRQRMPETARTGVPVPVWLTLGSWDPSAQGLGDWVTATISRDHPYLRATDFGLDAVARLFDTGRIALFLDGLDEMPDMLRNKAVERLTTEAAGRRLVITSRPDEFREAIDLGRRQLPYTAVIELRPVAAKAAARYLLEGQIGAARQAWQPVADHLLADPHGVLAQTLNTPLTLSLAHAAYTSDDPGGLVMRTSVDEHELRVHLLDQIFIAAYTDPGERDHAIYWLGWLAHKMATQPNGPTRDLHWWQIPSWIPRWQVGLTGALVAGLAVTAIAGLGGIAIYGLAKGLWLADGLVLGLVAGLVVGLVTKLRVQTAVPRSITIRWPKGQFLNAVGSMVVPVGLVGGVVLVLLVETSAFLERLYYGDLAWAFGSLGAFEASVGFAGGAFITVLLFGIPTGVINMWRVPLASVSATTPGLAYQRDLRSHLAGGLLGGLVGALLVGLIAVLEFMITTESPAVQILAIWRDLVGFGLMVGLLSGLLSGAQAGAAPSLLFTELAFWLRGRRVRFMPLLETALARQVLRQAGAVYQFRHADLQDRLADRYEAGLVRRPTA